MTADIRRILRLLRPERRNYAVGLLALFVVNLSDVIAPIFMAVAIELTEAAIAGGPPQTPPVLSILGLSSGQFTILIAVGVFLGLHAVGNLSRYPMLMYVAVPSHMVGQRIRRAITGHLLDQTQSFYDRVKSGDLMSRATADVQAVRMMLGPGILVAGDTLMIMSLVLIVLAILSWQLTLIAMIPLPIIYWVTNKLSHAEYEGFEAVQDDLSDMTERVRESYAGLRIIQGYAREDFDRERFHRFSWRHLVKQLKLARVRSLFHPTLDLMLGTSTVLVVIFGGVRVVEGTMTLGTFVAFLFLVSYLAGPMIGFGWAISLFQRGRASLRRIDSLLDTPVDIVDAENAVEHEGPGEIVIRDLDFAYPAAAEEEGEIEELQTDTEGFEVLHDIDLEVPPGSTLGVFGPVGAGKSTLTRLLTRLYDPPPGTVFLDGIDIRDIEIDALRRDIVLAPQETFLFSSTVARNIQLAHDDVVESEEFAGFEAVQRLAELAHLHGEVVEFSEGYSTLLGERGVNLSGGQRQRLAIARALGADPNVLILDDCLSAVDAQTEESILGNLREMMEGRTGIIVSHRVRAVRSCDQVVVIEDGRITERGTHEELMENDGYYSMIAREQQERDSDDSAEPREEAS